jgi:hypothetical protein
MGTRTRDLTAASAVSVQDVGREPEPQIVPGQVAQLHAPCRWATVRYALDSNARTLRLCLILLVGCVPAVRYVVLVKDRIF